MKKIVYLLILFLLLVNISLIIACFSVQNWSQLNVDKKLGLYSCTDCQVFEDDWNFECLARSTYSNPLKQGEYTLYRDLYNASYSYLALEYISLIMSIMLLEDLLLKLSKAESNSKVMSISIASLMFIFHLAGTVAWFGYTKAGASCNVAVNNARPSVCYETGPIIAISNCIFMLVTVSVFILLSLRSSKPKGTAYINTRLLGIGVDKWAWISLFLCAVGTTLMLVSLTIESWVDNNRYYGSLYRCKDCTKTYWMGWDCLKGTACAINPDSKECLAYKNLYNASKSFIICQAAAIVFLALFLKNLTAFIKGNNYGNAYANYFYAFAMSAFNLASIITWFSASNSTISSNCQASSPCATKGPQISIASNFAIVLSAFLYIIIHYKRSPLVGTYHQVSIRKSIEMANIIQLPADETEFAKASR